MKKTMSKTTGILLFVLCVLILGLLYMNFVHQPVQMGIDSVNSKLMSEQSMIDKLTPRLAKLRLMNLELADIKANGKQEPLPDFDNSEKLITELHSILAGVNDYSLSFGTLRTLADAYIICRPLNLSFRVADYSHARSIIDALHGSSNINQISNLSIEEDKLVKVDLTINFFELKR